MAKVKVGINGFGRIGRQVFKSNHGTLSQMSWKWWQSMICSMQRPMLTCSNMIPITESSAGTWKSPVMTLSSMARPSKSLPKKIPASFHWGDLGVDIVIESTGVFTDAIGDPAKGKAGANVHIAEGRRQESHHLRSRQE